MVAKPRMTERKVAMSTWHREVTLVTRRDRVVLTLSRGAGPPVSSVKMMNVSKRERERDVTGVLTEVRRPGAGAPHAMADVTGRVLTVAEVAVVAAEDLTRGPGP